MIKVLFICHGNICRSPMAEYIFKKMICENNLEGEVYVESCATSREEIGNDIYPPAKKILTKYNVPYDRHSARQITRKDFADFDYIIAMEEYNLKNMRRTYSEEEMKKVSLLMSYAGKNSDVSDPWYTGDFETAYQDILEGCSGLLEKIKVLK